MIAGRYTLQREIGRGGAGVVWLAEDSALGREVALKRHVRTDDERTAGRAWRECPTHRSWRCPGSLATIC